LIFDGHHGDAPGQFKFLQDDCSTLSGNEITTD